MRALYDTKAVQTTVFPVLKYSGAVAITGISRTTRYYLTAIGVRFLEVLREEKPDKNPPPDDLTLQIARVLRSRKKGVKRG